MCNWRALFGWQEQWAQPLCLRRAPAQRQRNQPGVLHLRNIDRIIILTIILPQLTARKITSVLPSATMLCRGNCHTLHADGATFVNHDEPSAYGLT